MNRLDPNSPFPRAFYPGEPEQSEAKFIKVKDGQQILNANIKLQSGYPTRTVKVQLKWEGGRPPGEVTVTAQAEKGDNPAARKISARSLRIHVAPIRSLHVLSLGRS